LYRFLAITVLLDVKDIPQVGPLQWGWITLKISGAKATNTLLSSVGSEFDAFNGSDVQSTIIQNGSLLVDATSTVETVTFRTPDAEGTAILGLENPTSLKTAITSMQIGDVIKLGGLGTEPSPGVVVTKVTKPRPTDPLTITYDYGQQVGLQVSYSLPGGQSNKFTWIRRRKMGSGTLVQH
jgi:hypothetical protein